MADIIDVIKERRSIKYFLPKFVSWENISKVIDAGRHAPSCGNIQNWKFIVVIEPDLKQSLAQACHEQYEIVPAGALIVVCAEPEKAERYYGERGRNLYSIQNCAAAVQNMLLEAHSIGLGTRWIGAFDDEEICSLLKIPKEIVPQAVVALGYPKEIPEKPPKYPLESLVYFNHWRNRIRDVAKYINDYATIIGRKAQKAKAFLAKSTHSVVDKAKEKISLKKEAAEEKLEGK